MLALDSFEDVQRAFIMAKEDLSEILSGNDKTCKTINAMKNLNSENVG